MTHDLELLTRDELAALTAIDPAATIPDELDADARDGLRRIVDAPEVHDVVPRRAARLRRDPARRVPRRVLLVGVAAAGAALAIVAPSLLGDDGDAAFAAWAPVGTVAQGALGDAQRLACSSLAASSGAGVPNPAVRALLDAVLHGELAAVTEVRGPRRLTSLVAGDVGATCLTTDGGRVEDVVFHGRVPAPSAGSLAATTYRSVRLAPLDGAVLTQEALERQRAADPEAPTVFRAVVGPDVVAVTLLGPDLEPTRATLVDSVAVAWWPGSVDRAATVRLRLSDGTQRELLLTDVLVTDPGELRVIEVEPGTEETDGMVTIIDG